jgi:hypothetical protein
LVCVEPYTPEINDI